MNYKLHYDKLIERAKNRKLDCYKEVHHIKPKCLGGLNDKDNLVELTAREHFIAHMLLVKINPKKYGLIKAVNMMCISSDNQNRSMNRMYEWLREKFSNEMSRSQTGYGNSQHGTMWICNTKTKENKKILKNNDIPNGWVKGRNVWKKDEKLKKKKLRQNKLKLKKLEKDKLMKLETMVIFKKYINSDYLSLNSFAKKEFDKSLVTLTKRFIKYIDGYKEVSMQGSNNLKKELSKLI